MIHTYLFVYEWKYSDRRYEKIINSNTTIEAKNIENAINEFYRIFQAKGHITNTILNIIKIK